MNRFLNGWIEQLESQATGLDERGDHLQAAEVRRRLCDGMARHLGEEAAQLIGPLEALGTSLRLCGALEEAETLYRRRLRLIRNCRGQRHLDFARGINQLGVLYCEMGRYRRAAGLYRRLLSGLKSWSAIDAPSRAALHHNLANAYQSLGQGLRAQEHYEAARDLIEALGPSLEHAQCLCDLAESLAGDQPQQARHLLEEASREVRQVFTEAPAELARALIRIAGSYFRMHHVVMADRLLQESIGLLESSSRVPGELRHCRDLLARVQREHSDRETAE